jgi:ABC-2 type transport system ATP-binding protein
VGVTAAVQVRGLTKTFGRTAAVQAVSFTAPAGKITGFLGPNGSGKTTTLRMILGLVQPTAGDALIGDVPYRELTEPRRHVGALLEATGFHPAGGPGTTCASSPRPAGCPAAGWTRCSTTSG